MVRPSLSLSLSLILISDCAPGVELINLVGDMDNGNDQLQVNANDNEFSFTNPGTTLTSCDDPFNPFSLNACEQYLRDLNSNFPSSPMRLADSALHPPIVGMVTPSTHRTVQDCLIEHGVINPLIYSSTDSSTDAA